MHYEEFCKQFNISLNEQQAQAVRHTEGAVLLLAVPGSGKTTALVARLGYMLYCVGVAPERILTMTYTVSAAGDMKNRFATIFGDEYAARLQFRTINGVCASIINGYVRNKGTDGFDLLDDNRKLLTEIYRKLRADYPVDGEVKELQKQITYIKNMCLTRQEIDALDLDGADIGPIYDAYIKEMKRRRLMDYDDQLVYAYNILKSRPDILKAYQRRYPYLCVDEAQDTSKIQHRILHLLAGKSGNLFMVGDEDQSIYGFRAAYPDALMRFEGEYSNSTVLLLEENFRSTPEIVSAAEKFITRNTMRHEKHMRASRPSGAPVRKVSLASRAAQYSYLAKMAQGEPQRELSVLYRNNDSAVPLIDFLDRNDIPYCIRQTDGVFFTSRTVSGVRDLMTLALSPLDTEAFMRIYYKLNLPISRADAEKAVEFCRAGKCVSLFAALSPTGKNPERMMEKLIQLRAHFAALRTDSAADALKRMRYQMGYGAYLMRNGGDDERLYLLSLLASREKNIESFLKRLDALKCMLEASGDRKSNLILSTIHSSKGLEYDRVAVIDAVDGILPSVMLKPGQALDKDEQTAFEEERRLFYVAATRAKNELLLMRYEKTPESTFIRQLCEPMMLKSTMEQNKKMALSPSPAAAVAQRIQWIAKDYINGASVEHNVFGRGMITEKGGDTVTIRFADETTKRFILSTCLEKGMLRLQQ
ncbi:ATP-dependent helicase [Oscillibacter sp.]|uniref:ATP-dependent helicase n=1 Tax=Oscillibacter sp. TaxID=1945593 RepID=UPI0028B235D1|nr:ATP-dependent helicase [Oscillibacter sp.]